MPRRFGRPPTTTPDSEGSGRLALRIDERIKMKAAVWALRHGMTMSMMVEKALVAYMRGRVREREPVKPEQLPLDGGKSVAQSERPSAPEGGGGASPGKR